MADSQLDTAAASDKPERPSIVRFLLWAAVGLALILGVLLFFRYTRLMTPLL